MTSTTILEAGPEAAELCAQLHASGFDPGWSVAEMAALLGSQGVCALVLPDAGGPVGLAIIRTVADESELLTIAVPEERRGEGLGRRLLDAALSRARGAGAERMFLEVSERNAPAERLYRAAGFEPSGRRRGYYRDGSDALVMARSLRNC